MTRAALAIGAMALGGAVLVTLPGSTTRDLDPQTVRPCATEDAPGPCVWDASSRGNGRGTSFFRDASGVEHFR